MMWNPETARRRPPTSSANNLGLNHASTLDFGSLSLGLLDFVASNAAGSPTPITAVATEYGDDFSVIGYPWINGGPYSAEHRVKLLGWIPKTDESDITASGTDTLVPAETVGAARSPRAS